MNFETTMKRPNPNPRPELCRWSFHKKHSWQKQVKSSQQMHAMVMPLHLQQLYKRNTNNDALAASSSPMRLCLRPCLLCRRYMSWVSSTILVLLEYWKKMMLQYEDSTSRTSEEPAIRPVLQATMCTCTCTCTVAVRGKRVI